MIKTKGRRRPFSCGHRGFGKNGCARCAQGNQLLERAAVLESIVKNSTAEPMPDWVHMAGVVSDKLKVCGGGTKVVVEISGKMAGKDAFKLAAQKMREEAKRLLPPKLDMSSNSGS